MTQEGTMSREEFSKLIGPYLDGELSVAEREKVEKYLADSADYRQLASDFEKLDRIARADTPPPVSTEEWQEVLSSVRKDEKTIPFTVVKTRALWLAPLAGLAALLCIGLFLWSRGPGNINEAPVPKKDYASSEDADDENKPQVDTVNSEEKEEEDREKDPRFDEE